MASGICFPRKGKGSVGSQSCAGLMWLHQAATSGLIKPKPTLTQGRGRIQQLFGLGTLKHLKRSFMLRLSGGREFGSDWKSLSLSPGPGLDLRTDFKAAQMRQTCPTGWQDDNAQNSGRQSKCLVHQCQTHTTRVQGRFSPNSPLPAVGGDLRPCSVPMFSTDYLIRFTVLFNIYPNGTKPANERAILEQLTVLMVNIKANVSWNAASVLSIGHVYARVVGTIALKHQ